ncbi:MAG: T9SS type A sorting domain-containing protein [Bacteroidia bacterium]
MKKSVFLLLCLITSTKLSAQISPINFQFVSEHEYTWTYSCYSAVFDGQDRPYIYSANNELGFMVHDISDINNPVAIDTMMPAAFSTLKASKLFQQGDYVYVALGGFQGFAQRAGLAILNITDPENITIEDQWDSTAFNQGCAIAIVEGDFAYLGIMELGIVILNVADKSNIQFVSTYQPDPNWPHVPGLFSTPNARGMTIRNDTLYLCYDAGSFRVIDVTDKENPVEVGHYINPTIDATAQPAYNNVMLVDNYAYVTVDYCGIDIVDISDPENPVNAGWVNPWNCNTTNWDGRPGHTNELKTWANNSILFVSGGDTEILAYDITDRTNPVELGSYFTLLDSMVAWGIDIKENYVVLSQVDNPFGQPYDSDWGGIRILHWDGGVTGISQQDLSNNLQVEIYPNPANGFLMIKNADNNKILDYKIQDNAGRLIKSGDVKEQIDVSELTQGFYHLVFSDGSVKSFVKN